MKRMCLASYSSLHSTDGFTLSTHLNGVIAINQNCIKATSLGRLTRQGVD